MRIEPDLTEPAEARPLRGRLGWLALYWAGGVAALTVVAGLIHAAL